MTIEDDDEFLDTEDEKDPWGQTFEDYVKDCEKLNPGSTGYTSDFD